MPHSSSKTSWMARVLTGNRHKSLLMVSVFCYLLNSFWVWLCVHRLGLGVTLSIIPMIFATPWFGFALNRFWAFAK